ncbi:MAG: VOC family protein [Aeromicrobium sp.]
MATLNPYLNFDGTAAEAMAFYQSVLGGDVDSNSFGEFGMSDDPDQAEKIMHSQLQTPTGFVLMAADVPDGMPYDPGNNISISISGTDEDELRGWFDALADGGTVSVPFETAPWGDVFGMLTDRFGINWMVNATKG